MQAGSANPKTDLVPCSVDGISVLWRKLALGRVDTTVSQPGVEEQFFLGLHHKFCVYIAPLPNEKLYK